MGQGGREKTAKNRTKYILAFYFKKMDTKQCLPINLAPSL